MKLTELLQDKKVHDGLAIFGSQYAKRMLEHHYDEIMNSSVGRKLKKLDRPTKLGIEAALNFLAAFVLTKEEALTNQTWKKFVFEILSDAPAEFNKRLLNGTNPVSAPVAQDGQIALELLTCLDEESQDKLLRWLQQAGEKERQEMANKLSQKVSAAGIASSMASDMPPSQNPSKSPSLLSDLAGSMSRLNERLEQRRRKKASN